MEVTESVANWLREESLLQFPPSQENKKFYLHEQDAKAFENGLRLVPLIKRIFNTISHSERPMTPFPELNTLKDLSTPAAKLYNWNILIKALEAIEVSVDPDMKSLIMSGDRAIVAEIINTIKLLDNTSKTESRSLEDSKKKKRQKLLGEGALLLDDLDPNSELSHCDSTLEFLILSFCKSFNINAKVAAGLLMQSGKFLAQVLNKGLKNRIEPVLAWFDSIIGSSDSLTELIVKEKNSLNLILGSIKGGLLSKDFLVVQKCCEALGSLNNHLQMREINTWDWFAAEAYSQSFKAYDCYKEDVTTYILGLLLNFGRHNLKDVFGQMIITAYPEPVQCFNVISSFWGYISEESQAYENIQSQGLVDYWVELGLREADRETNEITQAKVSALGFLCDVWAKFSRFIEQHEDSANSILTVIKRACREKSRILKVICYGRLFQLLSLFSKSKNSYSPIIYKTLTFALVENYTNDRIREFLLNNFLSIMEEINTLPVSVLLEPYIKQTQVMQKPKYNTADFDFYVAVARHSRLTIKDAIIVADNLAKIYYSDSIFANSAEIPLVLIIGRFIDVRSMQEFINKFLQLGLKIIYSRLTPKSIVHIKETITKEEYESERVLSYYKKLVFSLTEKIIHLGNLDMNHDIKEMLIVAHLKVKEITGGFMKGLKYVLDLLGDSSVMIERYENNRNSVASSSEPGKSYETRSIASLTNSNHRRVYSLASRSRDRALSDIERVKQIRQEREHSKKNQSEFRKREEEKQKKILRSQLEQRKLLLGIEGNMELAHPIVAKEINTVIEMPFFSIEEETKPDQEIIFCAIKKYGKACKSLFNHYASTGYKIENFKIKATFESILDKRITMGEGELVKLLRDHGVSNNLITTEEIRKVVAWMHQKLKTKSIDFESFPQVLYYISSLVFTRHPLNYSHFPPGICLLVLMDQFQKKPSKAVPLSYFHEPDFGVGDKDILKMLNLRIIKDPNFPMPEGYKKVTEKDIMVTYAVPSILNLKKSYVDCAEVLDSILNSALKLHFLQPVVSIFPVVHVKGILVKPQIESEDKIKEPGVPYNKASYKLQPLPVYMSFTPGIKLEVAKLAGKFSNDDLLECARVVDDLIHTVSNKSFEIISRNPKPAGSIPNKVIQQKEMEEAQQLADRQKHEAKRKLHKQLLEERLKQLRVVQESRSKEEEESKAKEKLQEDLKKKQISEIRNREKQEIERKIKEFRLKKEEDENLKFLHERDYLSKLEEKKRRDREEFLRQARKKLIDNMNQKKEKKQKVLESPLERSKDDVKKDQRKTLMQILAKSKTIKAKESSTKEQVYSILINPEVVKVLSLYSQSIDLIFQYFCKLFPLSNMDTSQLALAGFSKFVSLFAIVPSLVTLEEAVRLFKANIKNKSGDPSITNTEFREMLITIAVLSASILEKEAGRKPLEPKDLISEFFNWISFPVEVKKTSEMLKKLGQVSPNINPRDKKRQKNTLIKGLIE